MLVVVVVGVEIGGGGGDAGEGFVVAALALLKYRLEDLPALLSRAPACLAGLVLSWAGLGPSAIPDKVCEGCKRRPELGCACQPYVNILTNTHQFLFK